MSAVLGCAAQDFAAGPRFAGERPTAADWRWRSAAEQRGWPDSAVSADAAAAPAVGAAGSVVAAVAAGPTVGCAVGGQPAIGTFCSYQLHCCHQHWRRQRQCFAGC